MTESNNLFAQFKVPAVSYSSKTKEQEQQKIKSRKTKNITTTAGGTIVAGFGGFAIAGIQEKDSFERLQQSATQLKIKLTEQFNKSDKIIQLNKNIAAAEKGLAAAENNLAKYHKELATTQKQSQIDILNDLIKTANDMKDLNKSALDEWQKTMTSYYKQYIQEPLKSFTEQEKALIKKNKIKTTSIATMAGFIISLSAIFINKHIKENNK